MAKYFTKEGLEKIKKELRRLETVERRKIAERIRYAASFGDLRENAAYQEAKDDQGFLEREISRLRKTIAAAKIIKKESGGKVEIGSGVLVESGGEKIKFTIVDSEEVNLAEGKISFHSPLGKALLGKPVGAVAQVETASGRAEYRIVKIF